ncbi:uncharacterized protein LOC129573559 [Sitodiplosis mosellana]|uniref:uncharacterized protein LOC129573559 n=1 Tax=Sitodiplosis mosellana TaxID=263140 RepID=UPI002443D158|nr:uncharacterized protein LOC129573559 [Sitodiplosis mosellana]
MADIAAPGKFLTVTKEAYANDDEDVPIQFNAIILSETEILTCAHNVHGAPYVYVIVNKLSSNLTKIKITEDQIEIHEESSGFAFDIAKITLEEPLEFNDNVGSIDLVDKDYKLNDPSEMITVYGDMVLGGTSRTRRYDIKYLNGAKCKSKYGDLFDANHLMCYTLDESMGTPSTFGGPMISKKNNKLVGMTIFGLPDKPVIFQPIAPLLDWIRKPKMRHSFFSKALLKGEVIENMSHAKFIAAIHAPAKFSDTVGRIDLVDKDYKLNDPSEVVIVYGYGMLYNIGPMILRRCDANYIFDVERATASNIRQTILFTTGEASKDGEIITAGDSGGPVVSKTNGKIVGITTGINGTTGGRGMFLPITPFLDFIHDPKSVKPLPPSLTPNEAKFMADIAAPAKFLTATKEDFADADEDVQLKFNAIILSETEILTCAHNVHGAPYVYVMVNTLSSNPTKIKVTKDQIEIHQKYALSGFAFDVAKITLEEPLEFNDNVGSIDLVDKDYIMNDPSEMVTVYGEMILSGTIRTRRYDTKYLDGAICKPKLDAPFGANHLMCYTLDGSMGTPSTFGGPMISKMNNKLVGMTIIGLPDKPVIFQPIAPLLDWIRKPRSVRLTPKEAKFIADITVPGKFLSFFKENFADADEDEAIEFNAIILSKTEILTCAHSVHGAPYVYVTVNKLSRNAKQIKVTKDQIEIHQKYALLGFAFDIAKITLEEPLEFNDNVGSIDLVDKDYKLNDPSQMVTVYGDVVFDGTIQTRRYDTKYLDGAKCKSKLDAAFDANHLMCYTLDGSMRNYCEYGSFIKSKVMFKFQWF